MKQPGAETDIPKADVEWKDSNPLAFTLHERESDSLAMVRAALRKRRVCLAYQPVVLGMDTARIGFHEGLIRLLDPSGRPIPAASFMHRIEADELGREIDCAALDLGLAALAAHPDQRIAINMSARSIGYPRWMRTLRERLAEDGTLAERLILEISESSAMELPEIVMAFLRQWRPRGISFAMDDYGSGKVSIPQLHAFDFDILKIDGRFTRRIAREGRYHEVTAALLSVARQFDMMTVAEAVETEDDARWLTALGVDMMQGYAFGAPTIRPDWLLMPDHNRGAKA